MRLFNRYIKIFKRKSFYVLLFILLILFLIGLYFVKIVNPLIINSSEVKVKSLTLKAINSAISDVMSESVLYNDLVNVITDENGKIVMLNANSIMINKLSKELVKCSQTKLSEIGDAGMAIPLGNFTGISLFIGLGPEVKVKLIPIGSVYCSFESKFETSGINQTHHRIYVNVEASVNMVLPIKNIRVKTSSQVLITESIIVGEVPNTYLHSNSMQDMLDLIPD